MGRWLGCVHPLLIDPVGAFVGLRYSPRCLPELSAMAPHLSPVEQDAMLKAKGKNKTPQQIFDIVQETRAKRSVEMVNITVVRRFLKGQTHKRGSKETRGRPRTYIRKNVITMNSLRSAPKAVLQARQPGGQPGNQSGSQTVSQLARHEAGLARSHALTVSISQHTVSIQSALSQHSSQHVISLG